MSAVPVATVARTLGVTEEQVREGYRRNLRQLRGMLARAERVAPRKYRGYTVERLRAHVARFEALAAGNE